MYLGRRESKDNRCDVRKNKSNIHKKRRKNAARSARLK